MRRRRKMNFFVSLVLIILAIGGIAVLGIEIYRRTQKTDMDTGSITPSPSATQQAAEPTATPSPTPEPTATPTPVPPTVSLPVKGLYLTTNTVGSPAKLQKFIDLANSTEINAFVIDVKDDLGFICYETQVPLAIKHEAWKKNYDVKEVIRLLHENNIKAIARIVSFSDPLMPLKEPEMSLKNKSGSVFKVPYNNTHLAWLDPSSEKAWQYLVDISKEAIALGFDEIQYDYIRFPETTNYKYDMSYLEKEKSEYIHGFMQTAKDQLPGVILSADIFGSVCLQSKDAGGIGQTLETISQSFQYLSPMIYPSHYANDHPTHYSGNGKGTNINGVLYPKPDLEPYKIIYNTLVITKGRLEKAGMDIKVRPYLQGFTAEYIPEGYRMNYGVEQYRDQIQAVYDAGYTEWIFWNSRNTYLEEAFLPE